MMDPTTARIEALNAERDQLRAENDRLSKALAASYTNAEVLKAEHDRIFVQGYNQAVLEIRDHFKKDRQLETVSEIEKIWLKEKLS